jgi:hypothetical protein
MKIYIDSEFRCHTTDPDGVYVAVETDFFDGKCAAFVEGYRYVPADSVWVRSDGVVFKGVMIAPWKSYSELDKIQREYERQLLTEYAEALNMVGVKV